MWIVSLLLADYLLAEVSLNGMAQGDFALLENPAGLHLRVSDLAAMGIETEVAASSVWAEESQWLQLDGVGAGFQYSYEPHQQRLTLTVEPRLLGSRRFDVGGDGLVTPDKPEPFTLGLNYGFDGQCGTAEGFCEGFASGNASIQLLRNVLKTEWAYSWPRGVPYRGQSYLQRDFPEKRSRIVAGDMVQSTSPLGGGAAFAGLGYGTETSVDPSFIWSPLVDFASMTSRPADVEVYVNGVLRERRTVPAGGFELANLRPAAGHNDVTVVVRDVLGNKTVVARSVQSVPEMLGPRKTQYSVSAGWLRQDSGDGLWDYGAPVLMSGARLGVNSWLTAGAGFESTQDSTLASLEVQTLLGQIAYLRADLAASAGTSRGYAARVGTGLARRSGTWGVDLLRHGPGFSTIMNPPTAVGSWVVRTVNSIRLGTYGSIRISGSVAEPHQANRSGQSILGFGTTLPFGLHMTASAIATYDPESRWGTAALLSLTHRLGARVTGATHSDVASDGVMATSARLQLNPPTDTGAGGGVDVSLRRRPEGSSPSSHRVNGVYRSKYAMVSASLRRLESGGTVYSGSWRSAVSFVRGSPQVSPPLGDSFGLVKIGRLVAPVTYYGRPIGRTDRDGLMVLPRLLPYQSNRLELDMESIPMRYSVSASELRVVPVDGAGYFLEFDVHQLRAIEGTFVDESSAPIALGSASLGALRNPTGVNGEFFFDGVASGPQWAETEVTGRRYRCPIEVPPDFEGILDLGVIHCAQ